MSVSVCMATYNGAKYIRQQLESILRQSRRPDEVILCDDCSSDETPSIIQKFIEENGLQNKWKLYQNQENKGYPHNFYYAMSLCGCDIVFLADQDDIWHREKIASMCKVLEEHAQVMVVSCKLSLIDANGEEIRSIMAPTRRSIRKKGGCLRQVRIDNVFYKYEWPGMAMAYRREWYQSHLGGGSSIPHDFLISSKAAEEGGLYQMDEVLACHRRHDNNAGGEEHRLGRLLRRERKLREVEDYIRMLQELGQEKILQSEAGKEALERKLFSLQGRYEALQSGRLSQVLRNAIKHWRETRIKTLVCDLLIVLQ